MKCTIGILFLTLIGLGLLDMTPAEVSHEDIRGTLQSLIYSYNQLDNKLERHEYRERALGEMMKKGMQSLQKGMRNLEPLNGIFSRLDERVSQIETTLIAREEKHNTQTDQIGKALEMIFTWMRENDECIKRPPVPVNSVAPIVQPEASIPPEFIKQQESINKEILSQVKILTENIEKLLDASNVLKEQTEITFKSVPSTAEMLTKIEDKLISYSVATPPPIILPEPVNNTIFETKVFEKFGELATGLAELRATPPPKQGLTDADIDFIHELNNNTLKALENVKVDVLNASDNALVKSAASIKELEANIEGNVYKVGVSVANSTELVENFLHELNVSFSKLNEGAETFSKFNNILMTNSEAVLDTQRKVEFGTLQIVQKISDLLDKQRDEIVTIAKQRFDNVDESIVNTHMEVIQNLTSLIDTEISKVWWQMSVMNGAIQDNTNLLKEAQGRNEMHLNSTFGYMGNMGIKVDLIKQRMLDMEENLNYLLGKLSVISQEFKNIKVGLAESLEQLRNTFHSMSEKLPSQGPGPHNIKKNEYETELNLLKKRHTP